MDPSKDKQQPKEEKQTQRRHPKKKKSFPQKKKRYRNEEKINLQRTLQKLFAFDSFTFLFDSCCFYFVNKPANTTRDAKNGYRPGPLRNQTTIFGVMWETGQNGRKIKKLNVV